jgi:ParB-like chromosome segregation protein Spo0J
MKNSLELHPLATLFPPMTKGEYENLRDDIRVNGLQEPIMTWRGLLVDGRHRDAACLELGIQPGVCELEDCDDPTAYVLSMNLHRRHLSQSQRAQCAAEVARLKNGEAGRGREIATQNCLPIEQAAKAFSVSPRSVVTAKHVADKGDKAVVDAVKSGEITVSAASKLVDAVPDKKEQRKIVKEGKKAVAKATKSKTPKKRTAKKAEVSTPEPCPNCGSTDRDEDGDCTGCLEPSPEEKPSEGCAWWRNYILSAHAKRKEQPCLLAAWLESIAEQIRKG